MKLPIYQVDAFSDRVFGGNPAAVCPIETWPDDAVLQSIAAENNLSETAYCAGGEGRYQLRWFTPEMEVDLCGHATLATAYVVLHFLEPGRKEVRFDTRSGCLTVRRTDERLELDLPAMPAAPCAPPALLLEALECEPQEVYRARRDTLAVFKKEEDVLRISPRMNVVAELESLGLIITAPGADVDFVSRYFAPRAGIPEDPVCGSAHCTLAPYWAARLGKEQLTARQVSRRGGELTCRVAGDRVVLAGHAACYLEGTITV